jgi:chromosomal replication initiator protein
MATRKRTETAAQAPSAASQTTHVALAASRPDCVQTISLRVPAAIRGHGGRPTAPQVPLLPVFIAGEENRFAWFACQSPIGQIALTPRELSPTGDEPVTADTETDSSPPQNPADENRWGLIAMSPLLLVGPAGCGKTAIATHLATRILDEVAPSIPAAEPSGLSNSNSAARSTTSLFMPGVDFARYYARAVDSDEITRFRRDIDSAPVLVIDDVHLMAGKPASQDELASRIENRSRSGRPTILTSRRLPTQVAGLRPLLVSRMLPGLTIPIRQPGTEARRELLLEFSRRRQLAIGDEELDLLCEGLEADLPARNLDSAMAHVDLYCRMKGCQPNVHAVRAAIGSIQPTSDLSTDRVAKVVSRRYKLKLSDLKSGTRRQEVVRARSLAMYLTRQLTGSSYHQIGKYFGGRDHTTVLHACRKTESMMQDDTELRVTADEVTEQLKATG